MRILARNEGKISGQFTSLDLFLTREEATEMMHGLASLLESGHEDSHIGHFHVFDLDSQSIREIQASLYDPAHLDQYDSHFAALFKDSPATMKTFDWSYQDGMD